MLASTRYISRFMIPNSITACLCKSHGMKYRNKSTEADPKEPTSRKNNKLGDIGSKYQVFHDEDAEIILDVYEERLKYSNLLEEDEAEESTPFEGLNLESIDTCLIYSTAKHLTASLLIIADKAQLETDRKHTMIFSHKMMFYRRLGLTNDFAGGESGVFEIQDLVEVLKRENSLDIFVAKVPKEAKYVDYICIISGKSKRHMQAIAQFVRRVFKQKRHKGDTVPKLEGGESKDWIALDLGNIALHIFSQEARTLYDLDSLWAVGPEYDDEFNKPEPISEMLDMHAKFLNDVKQMTQS